MNSKTGLKHNHLIRIYNTGRVTVYTDKQDANKILKDIPGVVNVFSDEQVFKSEHHLYFDPRYSRDIVIKNIQEALAPTSLFEGIQEYYKLHPLIR